MKYFYIIIFIILILFLQIGIFPNLKILGVFPNLILISLLSLIILQGWGKSIIWIVISGLLFDFLSLQNILGISIVILLIDAIIIQFLSNRLLKKNNYFSVLLVFLLGIIIYELLFLSFPQSLMRIIYNLVFALPIFYLMKTYANKLEKIQSQKKIL